MIRFAKVTAILLVLTMWMTEVEAKNILSLRIDTLTVGPAARDVVVNVYFKLETTSPVDFHGFTALIGFDAAKVQASGAFFDGTATANTAYHIFGTSHDTARIVVLGNDHSIRTDISVLFSLRLTVFKGLIDTTFLKGLSFKPTSNSGIDSVSFAGGWVRVQQPDTVIPKKDLAFHLSGDSVQSDSSKKLSVVISDPVNAKLREGIFRLRSDTSFEGVSVRAGMALGPNGFASILSQDSIIEIRFGVPEGEYVALSGEIIELTVRAAHRVDTICLRPDGLDVTVLNSDNLVGKIIVTSDSICVLGVGTLRSVEAAASQSLAIWPNPANGEVFVRVKDPLTKLTMINTAGIKVFEKSFGQRSALMIANWKFSNQLPAGSYVLEVLTNRGRYYRQLQIVHDPLLKF